ncbi:MAG: GTPase HflX [Gemmatimonadetes bacterium]|nr:GTPase HflX [Gemmatimonadota bacterium]
MALAAAEEHLTELARLADTAGAQVALTLRQRLDAPHPKYYIGEGKAQELKGRLEYAAAELVIFDEELAPAQGKNLEDFLGVRVMDRTELILDIFATRARTAEAQMQVSLAQLEYLLPRLKRMWTHLSRIRGGIGLRGPGETQLETDRRIIKRRIRDLRQKLDMVGRRRATQRKARSREFTAALVGYTNAGKSSVLRALSGAELFIEDRLFATLDPATRAVDVGGARALVTDTVGFIRKLPHHLVASFRASLEESMQADLLLHVIDASHPVWEEQKQVVEEVLEAFGLRNRRMALVFNKVDRLTHAEEAAFRERVAALHPEPSVFASAVEPGGVEELRQQLRIELCSERPQVRVLIPSADGEALAAVYREGEVLRREEHGATVDLLARLPNPALRRLERRSGVQIIGVA